MLGFKKSALLIFKRGSIIIILLIDPLGALESSSINWALAQLITKKSIFLRKKIRFFEKNVRKNVGLMDFII